MPRDLAEQIVEREARYLVVDHELVEVDVHPSDFTDVPIDAVLLDLSSSGSKLRTREAVPEGQHLALAINAAELSGELKVDATVCWVRLAGGGEWWIGCSFEPTIPSTVLDRLAEQGVLDRRQDDRSPVSIDTSAAWELSPNVESVRIMNISERGFCLCSKHPGKPGARVMLRFGQQAGSNVVTGRCRWQIETDDGYVLGCEFARPNDYTMLLRIQQEAEAVVIPEKKGIFFRLWNGR